MTASVESHVSAIARAMHAREHAWIKISYDIFGNFILSIITPLRTDRQSEHTRHDLGHDRTTVDAGVDDTTLD